MTICKNNFFLMKIFLNENVEINVVNYRYVVVQKLKSINDDLFISFFMNDKSIHCYDAYLIITQLKNNWKQLRNIETLCYAINKEQNADVILKLSDLKKIDVKFDYFIMTWRFELNNNIFQIITSEKFVEEFSQSSNIYSIII